MCHLWPTGEQSDTENVADPLWAWGVAISGWADKSVHGG